MRRPFVGAPGLPQLTTGQNASNSIQVRVSNNTNDSYFSSFNKEGSATVLTGTGIKNVLNSVLTEMISTSTIVIKTLTVASRCSRAPLSIGLAGSTVRSLPCVSCVTGVGHFRVVGCTGASASAIPGSSRITTVDS